MTFTNAIAILKWHHMTHEIRDGKLFVADECCIVGRGVVVEWVCIDGWTRAQLYAWLGY